MKSKTTFLILWTSYVFLAVSVIVMLLTHTLGLMGILSPILSKEVGDILVSVWVPIGLGLIILIFCTEQKRFSTLEDQTPAQDDHIQKQWTVTGMAKQTSSSFTMDLHLSETNQLLKPLPGMQTGIQQQLSKDV
jgi:hypothetical protein